MFGSIHGIKFETFIKPAHDRPSRFETLKCQSFVEAGSGTHEPIAFLYRRRDDEENDDEANDAQGSNAREQSYF